jgi:hypothetical protein
MAFERQSFESYFFFASFAHGKGIFSDIFPNFAYYFYFR